MKRTNSGEESRQEIMRSLEVCILVDEESRSSSTCDSTRERCIRAGYTAHHVNSLEDPSLRLRRV